MDASSTRMHFLLATIIAAILACTWAINKAPERFRDVRLQACNPDWVKFIFGNEGDFAYHRFTVKNGRPLALRVTDAHCPGDEFIVYDWEVRLGTVEVHHHHDEDECKSHGHHDECKSHGHHECQCVDPIKCPDKAWESRRFAHREFVLRPGHHRLTIKSRRSPIGAGYGYLKLVPHGQCGCHDGSDSDDSEGKDIPAECKCEFRLSEEKMSHAQALEYCTGKKMKLAAVTSANFVQVSQQVYSSLGQADQVWVGSFNGDKYGDACLAFTMGTNASSGNINTFSCAESFPALCQY